jgi:SAM-dependent methyltransferase
MPRCQIRHRDIRISPGFVFPEQSPIFTFALFYAAALDRDRGNCPKRYSTKGVAARMRPAVRSAPAAARNREPILRVLREYLPRPALVLEIASGTGEHAVWFSSALSDVTWQPTDLDPEALRSIAAWRDAAGPPNLLPPLRLDAAADTWPVTRADAVVAINMVHIAPWTVTQGLMAGAARVLTSGGLVFLYGPFREGGVHTAVSNAAFDADLRARDPSWGIRDLDAITALARQHGIMGPERIAMPANNLSVVFRRR